MTSPPEAWQPFDADSTPGCVLSLARFGGRDFDSEILVTDVFGLDILVGNLAEKADMRFNIRWTNDAKTSGRGSAW